MGAVGGGVVNLVKAVYNSPTNRGLRGVEAVMQPVGARVIARLQLNLHTRSRPRDG